MAVIAWRKGSRSRKCRILQSFICCREQELRIEEFDNKILKFPAYSIINTIFVCNLPYSASLVPEAHESNFVLMTN